MVELGMGRRSMRKQLWASDPIPKPALIGGWYGLPYGSRRLIWPGWWADGALVTVSHLEGWEGVPFGADGQVIRGVGDGRWVWVVRWEDGHEWWDPSVAHTDVIRYDGAV